MMPKNIFSKIIYFLFLSCLIRFCFCQWHEQKRSNLYVQDKGDLECVYPNTSEHTFPTFEEAVSSVASHSNIHICRSQIELKVSITFQNVSDVAIIGTSSFTTVLCTQQGAGLEFIGVMNLSITNLKLKGCGSIHASTTQINDAEINSTLDFNSALYIINCTNVDISHVHILDSNGTGLVLYDTDGRVEITDSIFDGNKQMLNTSESSTQLKGAGGGGVHIEFTKCTPGIYCNYSDGEPDLSTRSSSSLYTIANCIFSENEAYNSDAPKFVSYLDRRRSDHQGLGRGGGLAIILNGEAQSNHFEIRNCTFKDNKATWGGGIYIVLQDESTNNSILMSHLRFSNNSVKKNGGGGVDLGFNVYATSNNEIVFDHCQFIGNKAMYGGGTRVYSSKGVEEKINKVKFSNCLWAKNIARFGAAVDIAPHVWEVLLSGALPTAVFENCEFKSNVVDDQETILLNGYKQYHTGRGGLMLTKFTANFSGTMVFDNNTGCAMYLSSSVVSVAPNTSVYFTHNSAFQGGAIEFIGFSALFVRENNYFLFERNRATRRGGAIYAYSVDKHNFVSSRSCFIQYHGNVKGEDKNVTFVFTHNIAGKIILNSSSSTPDCLALGHSIFSASLKTCIFSCNPTIKECHATHKDTFNCVGNFNFTEDINCEVSSSGGVFRIDRDNTEFVINGQLHIYPGREIELPISVVNDFNQRINSVYFATIQDHDKTSITTGRTQTYVSNRKITIYGKPGSTATLRLQKIDFRDLAITLNIFIRGCPPGYVLDSTTEKDQTVTVEKCVCSAVRKELSFASIEECDDNNFEAILSHGYWLGFQGNESEENIRSGYCPRDYCLLNTSHNIPSSTTKDDLDRMICGNFRTGILCGQCRDDYVVHYHSENLRCESKYSCTYGWLLYIVSELLPLTVLFVLTTVLNISFTSGAINGFILYAQIFDSIPITGDSFIIFPEPVYHMYRVTRMAYNMFNFDFFSHDSLSFCLWEGATSLDMLIFKLLTVVYAIILVIITVILMKYCCNVFQTCSCLRYSTIKSSVIHGLSSVLVMVSSQSVKVCFKILDYTYIYSKGKHPEEEVVYLRGNLQPFTGEHIKYAVIAVICLLVIGIPQLLLLVYPACFKILGVLRCSDKNKAAKLFFHTPYSKLKPFLDSFQRCFKDDCRIFAGLYFVYRVLIIAANLAPRLTLVYSLQDFFMLIFLVILAIAQPYRQRWHNVLDGLLLFNLAVIIKLTKFNYDYSKYYVNSQIDPLIYSTSVQLVLSNLPLLYVLIYAITNIGLRIRKYCLKKKQTSSTIIDMDPLVGVNDDELPARMRDDQESESDDENSHYQPFDQIMYDLPRYSL